MKRKNGSKGLLLEKIYKSCKQQIDIIKKEQGEILDAYGCDWSLPKDEFEAAGERATRDPRYIELQARSNKLYKMVTKIEDAALKFHKTICTKMKIDEIMADTIWSKFHKDLIAQYFYTF